MDLKDLLKTLLLHYFMFLNGPAWKDYEICSFVNIFLSEHLNKHHIIFTLNTHLNKVIYILNDIIKF